MRAPGKPYAALRGNNIIPIGRNMLVRSELVFHDERALFRHAFLPVLRRGISNVMFVGGYDIEHGEPSDRSHVYVSKLIAGHLRTGMRSPAITILDIQSKKARGILEDKISNSLSASARLNAEGGKNGYETVSDRMERTLRRAGRMMRVWARFFPLHSAGNGDALAVVEHYNGIAGSSEAGQGSLTFSNWRTGKTSWPLMVYRLGDAMKSKLTPNSIGFLCARGTAEYILGQYPKKADALIARFYNALAPNGRMLLLFDSGSLAYKNGDEIAGAVERVCGGRARVESVKLEIVPGDEKKVLGKYKWRRGIIVEKEDDTVLPLPHSEGEAPRRVRRFVRDVHQSTESESGTATLRQRHQYLVELFARMNQPGLYGEERNPIFSASSELKRIMDLLSRNHRKVVKINDHSLGPLLAWREIGLYDGNDLPLTIRLAVKINPETFQHEVSVSCAREDAALLDRLFPHTARKDVGHPLFGYALEGKRGLWTRRKLEAHEADIHGV